MRLAFAYEFLVQKPEEENEHVGDLGDGNSKVDLREIGHIYGLFFFWTQ